MNRFMLARDLVGELSPFNMPCSSKMYYVIKLRVRGVYYTWCCAVVIPTRLNIFSACENVSISHLIPSGLLVFRHKTDYSQNNVSQRHIGVTYIYSSSFRPWKSPLQPASA